MIKKIIGILVGNFKVDSFSEKENKYNCICNCGKQELFSYFKILKNKISCECEKLLIDKKKEILKGNLESGKVYGNFIFKHYKEGSSMKKMICECKSCKNSAEYSSGSFKRGVFRKCACIINKNKTISPNVSKKFGRLTMLEILPCGFKETKRCRCECECGSTNVHNYNSVIRGYIKSCGCGKLEKYKVMAVNELMKLDIPQFNKRDLLEKIYNSYKIYKRKK